jgi:hypothetical protein
MAQVEEAGPGAEAIRDEEVLLLAPDQSSSDQARRLARPFYRTPFFRTFVRSFLATLLSLLVSAALAFALGYGLYVWIGKGSFQPADVANNATVPAQPVLLAPTGAFGSQQKLVELPPSAATTTAKAAPPAPAVPPADQSAAEDVAQDLAPQQEEAPQATEPSDSSPRNDSQKQAQTDDQ